MNPKGRGNENVNFPSFDFLQVARGYFSAFGQLILRQTFAHPFPAHVSAEDLDSLPFFLGNCHGILHRFPVPVLNDTYIVKTNPEFSCFCISRCKTHASVDLVTK